MQSQPYTKKWYQSKLLWLGLLLTVAGAVPLVVALLQKGFNAESFVTFIGGLAVTIIRIWFTDTKLS